MPSGLRFPKNDFCKTLSGRNHGIPFCALSQRSLFQFLLPFLLAVFVCISAQTLPRATTCSYYSLYQVWQTWAYSLLFVQLACWHRDVFRWSGGQSWRLLPFHRRKHCWCAHTSLPANFQWSHRVVLVPFCIICSLHLIDVQFLQAIWLPEWSLQLPSFLALYVSKGRAGRSNTSLRTLCFHFAATWSLPSMCHMQGDWYCLALPYLAHMISRIFCHQSKCSAARSLPCFGTMPSSYRCLCVQSSISSPLHHLSYRRLSLPICF